MRKLITLTTFLLLFVLAGCTQNIEVQCGEGTIKVDGMCVIDDTEDPNDIEDPVIDDDENPDEPVVTSVCTTSIDDYGVTNYDMVWNDEFDTDGPLDPLKWDYMIGNGATYGIPGWGNGELQYYTNDEKNVNIQDGILKITATTEGYAQYGYTSGRVRTKDFGDFKYGVIEVCAQLPDTLGTWPAIWMLPTDSPYGGWPYSGEIDIMEAVGFETNTIHFNIHTENDNWGHSQSIGSHTNIPNIATEYHAYGIKWTETQIKFYVDGVEYFTYTPVSYSQEYWPFDQEFHLLLNIAVGGAWGGIRGIEAGDWQDSMYVDYVRVYQENGGQ